MNTQPTLTILIRTYSSREEIEMEVPTFATSAEIIHELIRQDIIKAPNAQVGPTDFYYCLFRKKDGTYVAPGNTLHELGVEDGEMLLIAPRSKFIPEEANALIRIAPQGPGNFLIVIKVMPSGDKYAMEVSEQTTVKEIFEKIFQYNLVLKSDPQGIPYIYDLYGSRGKGLNPSSTLKELAIEPWDVLFFSARLVAGGQGSLAYDIPSRLAVGEKERCKVRISTEGFKHFLLKQGLGKEAELNKIEIRNIMAVGLEENSIQEHLSIKPLNTPEQIVSDNFYSEWNFDLIPKKAGVTSVILRVSMLDIVQGFGEKRKDVFFLDKEIKIGAWPGGGGGDPGAYNHFDQVCTWSNEIRDELYECIGQNETGRALSKLANLFQKSDLDLFNAILLLQAQWNAGRNQHMLNLIPNGEWLMVQSKVNYSILEIIRNMEADRAAKRFNRAPVNAIGEQLKEWGKKPK